MEGKGKGREMTWRWAGSRQGESDHVMIKGHHKGEKKNNSRGDTDSNVLLDSNCNKNRDSDSENLASVETLRDWGLVLHWTATSTSPSPFH